MIERGGEDEVTTPLRGSVADPGGRINALEAAASQWTQAQAIELCRKIEAICPKYGCHVALTGGTLYKDGERKDADILFYRIRQVFAIDVDGLMDALLEIGVRGLEDYGWCYKAVYEGRNIDFFFPERHGVEAPGYSEPQSIASLVTRPTAEVEEQPF